MKKLFAALWVCAAFTAHAQVEVSDAWVRATGQGQKATGVFMNRTAQKATRLVGVKADLTSSAEVHEMKMDKDVMKMSALPNGLDLPAGKAVDLKPGGFHIMLMDLKLPLNKDVAVPLTLTFQDSSGKKSQQVVQVPVSVQPPSGQGMNHQHGDHKH